MTQVLNVLGSVESYQALGQYRAGIEASSTRPVSTATIARWPWKVSSQSRDL